jgi:hypothetical protein
MLDILLTLAAACCWRKRQEVCLTGEIENENLEMESLYVEMD